MEIVQGVISAVIASIFCCLLMKLGVRSNRSCVFVSYAEEDKGRVEFAIEVIKKSLKYSHKILTVKDIPPGSVRDCTKEIYIEQADICIVFLSSSYIKNDDCKYELSLMDNVEVIPIFLNGNEAVFKYSKNIEKRQGVFLIGCYSHRLIENKMMLLAKELYSRNSE